MSSKTNKLGRHWQLIPVILATGEAEIRRSKILGQPMLIVYGPYLENTQHKTGLAEWLKCRAPGWQA
jgi:hypothetical protein